MFVVARLGTEHTAAYQLGMGVFNLFLRLGLLAIAAQALLGKEPANATSTNPNA